jgi:murein DD-endopeptidase MepM/ murein hydrolase activator NlpD
MSYRIASQPHHSARAPQPVREPARQSGSRPHGASQASGRTGYTIAHAGQQVRFRPVAFWIAVGTFVVLGGWSITSATYFAFHDDVVKGLIARQTAQQYDYEDRIADLRAQIDRTTSRQLLDQEQFEQKLDELLHRQATLESRADALSGVTDPATTGSVRPMNRGAAEPRAKPTPLSDMMFAPQRLDGGKQSSIQAKLQTVEASLDRVEDRETAALDQMEVRYEGRAHQVRGVLDSLGLRFNAVPAAVGGPFVPVNLPPASEGFARALTRVSIARAEDEGLGHTLAFVPLRRPLSGELEMTSPFGVRADPFEHEAAMHTGMDFRGNVGDAIHATAAGRVTKAGWEGGYGQMVEIDHGEGLSTRYGHLSEIDVALGQTVRPGEVVGRLGSTGRSTGPHLHYETRVNGEPVNPEKFLAAGEKLFGG